MTMMEFYCLTESEQINMLYRHGVYVGKRKSGKFAVLLYQLDSFYSEVFYYNYRRHIYKIRCSDSMNILDPYLEQIAVEHLVS